MIFTYDNALLYSWYLVNINCLIFNANFLKVIYFLINIIEKIVSNNILLNYYYDNIAILLSFFYLSNILVYFKYTI